MFLSGGKELPLAITSYAKKANDHKEEDISLCVYSALLHQLQEKPSL